MFPAVLTLLVTTMMFLNICSLNASSCEVTYKEREGVIRCEKTEGSLSELKSTHLVLQYKCDVEEVFYKYCPKDSSVVISFETKDCAVTPNTFGFCKKYDIMSYRKFRGGYGILVLRNGTFGNYCSLREIFLSNNLIHTVESGAFGCLSNLYYLNISYNIIKKLPEGAFRDLLNLSYLDLSHNSLREIHSDLFRNLYALRHLDLSFNVISLLHNESFVKNDHLEYLDLSNNFLNEIKCGEFSSMYRVQVLNISNNNIRNVAENSFNDLRNLGTLIIANNNILPIMDLSSFPLLKKVMPDFKNIFESIKHLEILDMSNITSMDFNLSFSKTNKNIKYLDISLNVGLHLDENSLKNLKNLRTFNSQGTKVESLYHLFTHNTELEEINMSRNKFQTLDFSELMTAENLRKLDLSWNNINRVDNFKFKTSKLEYLNLSHNALQDIWFISEDRRLKVLDISSNRLTSIQWRYLNFIDNLWASNNDIRELFLSELVSTSLQTVHLEDCEIMNVHLHFNLEKKNWTNSRRTVFFMARNPIVCDCNAFQFYEYIKHHSVYHIFLFKGLTCRHPVELEGMKINNLLPGNFSCEVRRSCPETCRCLKRAHDHTVAVNCSRKDLRRLPDDVPANTTTLDISYNRITSLDSLNNSIWDNLIEILAEENLISSLEFELPESVKILHLRGNRLEKLPERHMAVIQRDLQMTLSDNPWSCGCESLKLKHFLLEHAGQILDASWVGCAISPITTRIILSMENEELCPPREKNRIFILMLGALSVTVFVFLLRMFCILRRIIGSIS